MFGKRISAAIPWFVIVLAAVDAAQASAQTKLWQRNDHCIDLDAMGDVDGDGVPDVVADAQGSADVKTLSGVDGAVISSFVVGTPGLMWNGYSVACIGDVDGDGFVDFLAGDPNWQNGIGNPVGFVNAISGKDGSTIYYDQGNDLGLQGFEANLGIDLAAAGDADADGFPDLLYGTFEEPTTFFPVPGCVRGVQPHSGGYFVEGLVGKSDKFFGAHSHGLAGVGDVDGDGKEDYAASSVDLVSGLGTVEVRSGDGTTLIGSHTGATIGEHYGAALRSCGDLDGDGVRELVIGVPGDSTTSSEAGRVDVLSGKTGTLLMTLFGTEDHQHFGSDMDAVRDVDGDGLPEIVVASYGTPLKHGRLELFSGGTGRQLAVVSEPTLRVRNVGDLNGDGRDDVCVTANLGTVRAFSFDLAPVLVTVTPARDRYDRIGTLALHGAGFTADPNLVVTVDGVPATNVSVTSFTDLTCTPPPALSTGPHDVTVTTQFGTATLAGGLVLTPAVFVDGDALLGATIDLRFEFDPLDSTFAIVGFAPQVSIPTPPFHGDLGIVPFVRIATLIAWPTDEYVLPVTVPNDPSLVGMTGLVQSLTGPKLGGAHRDGAWTNVATIAIH